MLTLNPCKKCIVYAVCETPCDKIKDDITVKSFELHHGIFITILAILFLLQMLFIKSYIIFIIMAVISFVYSLTLFNGIYKILLNDKISNRKWEGKLK